MLNKLLSVVAFAVLALISGCMTLTASKSLVVTPVPGETKIVVTSNAVTKCTDYLLFTRCTLDIAMVRQ